MNHSQLSERFAVVGKIAVNTGKKTLELFKSRSHLLIQSKGLQDFVTEADRENEREITQKLLQHFPGDTVFGEELGGTPSSSVWVIDPIDGTTNFIRGIPYFCISIAFVQNNVLQIGVVYDPVADELFSALKRQGAQCNGASIRASTCRHLSEAVMGIGYSRRTSVSHYAQNIERLMDAGCEYRRFGAAALKLAHAAAGRIDGYFEAHLNSWDALAGLLLNQEAGAYVAPFLTPEALTRGNRTLACSKNLEKELIRLLL